MKRFLLHCAIHSAITTAVACAATTPCRADPPPADATANPDDSNTRVRALFRKGVAAFNSGNNDEAIETLGQAWLIRQTYDVAAALGQAEIRLKRYRDAAEYLDFCLNHFAPIESEQTLQQIKNGFAEAKQHVGAFKVTVDHDGAEVLIDGRAVGKSPLGALAFVEPGVHRLTARLGGDQVTQTGHVDPGEDVPVEIKFGTARTTTTPTDQTPQNDRPSIVPVIVGGAVFVLGVGSAVAFELDASSKSDTATSLRARTGSTGCASGTAAPGDCSALRDALNTKDRDHNWATAGVVLASVAAVATPLYWFWPRSKSTAADRSVSSLAFRAGASPAGANLWLSGQF